MSRVILVLLMATFLFCGCDKEPGVGGDGSISGKIFVRDITSDGVLNETYYPGEWEVYIIYGDSPVFDDRVETHFDGTYLFEFLYPGNYTIFSYSDCLECPGGTEAIQVEVTIGDGEHIVLEDIVVND